MLVSKDGTAHDGDSSIASAVALTGSPERPKRCFALGVHPDVSLTRSGEARRSTAIARRPRRSWHSAEAGRAPEMSRAASDVRGRRTRMAHETKLGRESRRAQRAAIGAARLSVGGFTRRQRHQARAKSLRRRQKDRVLPSSLENLPNLAVTSRCSRYVPRPNSMG